MDEISKLEYDLIRCLGTCHNALQYENMNLSFELKYLFLKFPGTCHLFNIDKKFMFFFNSLICSSFSDVWDPDEIINAKKTG